MNISNIGRFDPALPQFFFSPADDGAGSGSGTGNNADDNAGGGNANGANNGGQNSNTDSNNSESRKAEIARLVQEALNEHVKNNNGDKDATLFDLTKKLHGVEKQRDDARANSLTKTDRDALTAFKALNLSPDDLKNIVSEHGSWKGERDNNAKSESLKKAAPLAGITNPQVLADLEGAKGVEYLISGEGDKAVATVKYKDASGAEVVKPMADWAKEKWPHLESILFAENSQSRKVTTYGKSAPAGGGGKVSLKEQILAEEKANLERASGKREADSGAGQVSSLDERLGRVRRN